MVHYSFCDLERHMTFKFKTSQLINFMKNKYFLLVFSESISTKREGIKKIIFTKTIILGCFYVYRYLAFIPTSEMELHHLAKNEAIATEDYIDNYIDNSDEHHPEHIA